MDSRVPPLYISRIIASPYYLQAVHSSASFISTSDSDVSPHTSAIVVDNTSVSTKDGWAESVNDPEIEFRKKTGLSMLICTVNV